MSYWWELIEWESLVAKEPAHELFFPFFLIIRHPASLPVLFHLQGCRWVGIIQAVQGSCCTEQVSTRTRWIMSSFCDVCCRGQWRLCQGTVIKHCPLKSCRHSKIWVHNSSSLRTFFFSLLQWFRKISYIILRFILLTKIRGCLGYHVWFVF